MNEQSTEENAIPTKTLNRYKLFLIFYELHAIGEDFLKENQHLILEYKVLNYSARYRLKV